MKKILSLILILAFVISPSVFLSGCGETVGASYTPGTPTSYVTLNVNPSVELIVDDKDKVIAVNANNEDGALLFYGQDYRGHDVDVVISEMIRVLSETGYIPAYSEQTAQSVFLSVFSTSLAKEQEVYSKIKVSADSYFEENGLFAIISETKMDNKIESYATSYSVVDSAKFRLMLKIMQYDADAEISNLVELNTLKLLQKAYDEIKKISSIEAISLREDYLAERLELKQQLALDFVEIYNDVTYTTLFNQLEVLKEQYKTAPFEDLEEIKTAILAKADEIEDVEPALRNSHINQVTLKEQNYSQDINETLDSYVSQSSIHTFNYDEQLTEKRISFMQYLEQRQEYARFNNFSYEYQVWKPMTLIEITTFAQTRDNYNLVRTQTRLEVADGLTRINPYTRTFGFGDGTTVTWTFP